MLAHHDTTLFVNVVTRERSEFTSRLKQAFAAAGFPDIGYTAAARMFNARSSVCVTTHAVRKWLLCGCIPSQPHIQTLSLMLACDPAWLRYGKLDGAARSDPLKDVQDMVLINAMANFNDETRMLVYDFIAMLKKNSKMHRGPVSVAE